MRRAAWSSSCCERCASALYGLILVGEEGGEGDDVGEMGGERGEEGEGRSREPSAERRVASSPDGEANEEPSAALPLLGLWSRLPSGVRASRDSA